MFEVSKIIDRILGKNSKVPERDLCPFCKGKGIDMDKQSCHFCEGAGYILRTSDGTIYTLSEKRRTRIRGK